MKSEKDRHGKSGASTVNDSRVKTRHIALIYGLDTKDYGWALSFYPVRRFIEAGEKLGITVRLILGNDVPHGGYRSLFPPGERVTALVRGAVPARAYKLLEREHIPCVNSLASRRAADNKLTAYRMLAEEGFSFPAVRAVIADGSIALVPPEGLRRFLRAGVSAATCTACPRYPASCPRTPAHAACSAGATHPKRLARGAAEALAAADALAGLLPLLAKPVNGSRGQGVRLLSERADLVAFLRERGISCHSPCTSRPEYSSGVRRPLRSRCAPFVDDDGGVKSGAVYMLQAWEGCRPGRDVRIFFCAGRVLACVERQGTGILSNASRGATVRTFCPPGRYVEAALTAARRAGLWYGTADFLWKNETELTFCELNASPGFEELERQTGINITESILKLL